MQSYQIRNSVTSGPILRGSFRVKDTPGRRPAGDGGKDWGGEDPQSWEEARKDPTLSLRGNMAPLTSAPQTSDLLNGEGIKFCWAHVSFTEQRLMKRYA